MYSLHPERPGNVLRPVAAIIQLVPGFSPQESGFALGEKETFT